MITRSAVAAARTPRLAVARIGDLAAARLAALWGRAGGGRVARSGTATAGSVESVYRNAVSVAFQGEATENGRGSWCGSAWAISLLREGIPLHPYAATVAGEGREAGESWEGAGESAGSGEGSAAAFLGAGLGEAVFLSGDTIGFGTGRLSISLGGARVWDSRLRLPGRGAGGGPDTPDANEIRDDLWRAAATAMVERPVTSHFLRTVMGSSGVRAECDCGSGGLMGAAAKRRLADLKHALDARREGHPESGAPVGALPPAGRDGPAAALIESLRGLVGFGEGLTPSGDDFLLGLVAALRFAAARGHAPLSETLARNLPPLAAGTTRESRRMLEAAVAGHYPEPVVELLTAAAAGDRYGLTHWTRRLAALGAASGQDMLAGMLFHLTRSGQEHGQESKVLPCLAAGGGS